MSGDIHAPTNAGPDLGPVEPAPEYAAGPSSQAPESEPDPAVIVGAAFAGGLIAALILKRLVR